MPPAAEDVLGELYAWDSVIEDDSTLPADDPQRDEDKTEDAFEQIIHTASGDASDIVLSLAAQLLHKHFFRFPHVQINVVEVLLKLCGPKRSQAVRIHTLRALLQIAKTPAAAAAASTPTSAASIARKNTRTWLQHIDEAVQHMLDTEKSSVILRQVTPLRQALEERLQPELDVQSKKSKMIQNNDDDMKEHKSETSSTERMRKKTRDERDAASGESYALSERELKKAKHDDDTKHGTINKEGKIVQLNRDTSSGDMSLEPLKNSSSNGRLIESEGRRSKINVFSPRNCPPCPYLFLGSVPRHTPNAEIVDFLTPVWPAIDSMSVQIKQPDHNATAYAFVSMPSIEHAREAIHFVSANKFRGRVFLNANFARGPPVDTVLFVERTGEDVNMEDKGAVRDFDFTKCEPEVWDVLCQQLERFGPLSFAENGCVRFRSSEHAKAAIRKQLFTVKGYEIYPVYDTKEQFAIDSTRRGAKVHNKQGFTLKSGRFVGGDSVCRGSKNHFYKEEDELTGSSNGRREHERVMSLRYSDRSRSPLRSDRESIRGRSRSYSPKPHSGGSRYDMHIGAFAKERRLPHSRSRSPVALTKEPLIREGGFGALSDKENCREFRSKYGHRSPSPMEVRSHESLAHVDELRGRPRERESPWMGLRSSGDLRERRDLREESRGRGTYRNASPSPSFTSRRSRKDERGIQRSGDYRRGSIPIEGGRQIYRETMEEDRGRMHPAGLSSGVLDSPRNHSRSPPRFGKLTGLSKTRPRSRSRSPQVVRTESSLDQRSSGYRGREERSLGNQQLSDERPSFPTERPRFTDDRSIAEVARDEQQERQRFFQQQQQSRREFHDADLSRYGAGRGGGRGGGGGRGRGDRYHAQHSYRGGRSGVMYRHDLPPTKGRSPSPLPLPAHHRSPASPLPHTRRRSSSPVPPSQQQQQQQQQRESYGRERHGEFSSRGRETAYSPPPSSLLTSSYVPGSGAPSSRHEFDLEVDGHVDREPSRHERHHPSRRDRSPEDKGHRSHRDRREKRPSHPSQSMTPSPIRREHTSGSSGRKSSGHSPRRSFSRRPEGDLQADEASGKEKQTRPKNEEDSLPQEKGVKNGGARLARDELFAGMDDLTVDYEEDDE